MDPRHESCAEYKGAANGCESGQRLIKRPRPYDQDVFNEYEYVDDEAAGTETTVETMVPALSEIGKGLPGDIPWPMVEHSFPELIAFDYFAKSYERELRYVGNGLDADDMADIAVLVYGGGRTRKQHHDFFRKRFCTMCEKKSAYTSRTDWRAAVSNPSYIGPNPFQPWNDMTPRGWAATKEDRPLTVYNERLIDMGTRLPHIPPRFRLYTSQAIAYAIRNNDNTLRRSDVPALAVREGFVLPPVAPGSNRDLDVLAHYFP